MLFAKTPGDILNDELQLWSDKLRLADHWSRVEHAYYAIPERQRLAGGIALLLLGLALAGWSWYRRTRPTAGQILRRWKTESRSVSSPPALASTPLGVPSEAPGSAFLVTEGRDIRRLALASELVLIGRDEENDVRLRDNTVHRYHAAVHHTNEGEFIIKDLSGDGGNGVYVNGHRVGERPLAPGDLVELGAVKLRFEKSQPVNRA
jgi:hypothetical protein